MLGCKTNGLQIPGGLPLKRVCVVVVMMVMLAVLGAKGQAPCSLDDVPVMDNFDLSKFVGKWYEIEWIAPTYQDDGNMWANFYHVYNSDDFGVVSGYYSGKDPNTGECFLGGVVNLLTSAHPAKLMQYTLWSPTESSLGDYWVLDTDYDSYSIVYSCVVNAGDVTNTCTRARSWLWGRTKSLPENVKETARTMFRNLCMNMTLLYAPQFIGEDCVPDSAGGAESTRSSRTAMFLLAPIVTLLLRFLTDLH